MASQRGLRPLKLQCWLPERRGSRSIGCSDGSLIFVKYVLVGPMPTIGLVVKDYTNVIFLIKGFGSEEYDMHRYCCLPAAF